MRPSPASLPGRRPAVAFALLFGALSACAERDPLGLKDVTHIEIETPALALRPGSVMQATATAYNQFGQVVDREITWSSRSPALVEVGATGLVRALRPGSATLRASVGRVSAEVVITQVNPPVALLAFEADSVVVSLPGDAVPLTLVIEDAEGLPIFGAPTAWASSAPRIAEVSTTGVVAPAAVGRTTVSVALEGIGAAVDVIVAPVASSTAPLVNAVTPSLIVPGQPVIITGERFGPMPAMNTVLVDGVPLAVTAASTVQLTAVLPTNHGQCLPTGAVSLQVSTTGGVGAGPVTLKLAPQRTLAVGEALVFESAAESACNELVGSEGRYFVAISNGSRALGAGPITLSLVGRTAAAPAALVAGLRVARVAKPDAVHWSPADERAYRRASVHLELLTRTREALGSAGRALPGTASLQMPALGGVVDVRIPNLDATNFCQSYIAGVAGRAVFVGEHIVILEDTSTTIDGTPTLAGQMDDLYQALGAEVETDIWPIVSQFGNPLVMDDRLDDNGRVFLVFSPRMNVMRDGAVLGAMVSCDFFPRAQNASSNVGEIVYAQVPLNPDPGTADGTRERWAHEIRTAIAHELKHIVGFAERIVRARPLEEIWLEEATARIAEELYARVHTGNVQRGNAVYSSGLQCEALFGTATPGCEGIPSAMLSHFEGLWSFLDAPTAHSPLGGAGATDLSFYGSGWSLTRWVIDQSVEPEAQVLRDLTISDATGLANLEARGGPGMGWPTIQGRWALSLMVDDRAGIETVPAPLSFASWDLADVFGGLCRDLGPCRGSAPTHPFFSRAQPLEISAHAAGDFSVPATSILPGGFLPAEFFGGTAGMRQLLHLRGVNGSPLPSSARLAIVRVQ